MAMPRAIAGKTNAWRMATSPAAIAVIMAISSRSIAMPLKVVYGPLHRAVLAIRVFHVLLLG
jgi:hypothetical protein